ncbi:hypothetical protein GE061_015140 [Apolygus lucorum]|uniref:F-BAR domain-containing protein n=1 Tax=Apolygus lucorum TaxID=248454 RepID=A0A6A4JDW3_APOLU|nr:hypothetical protein GE061_015140 [Apolygus lucorum]
MINDAHSQRIEINARMKLTVMEQIIPKLRNLKNYTKKRGLHELSKEFHRCQRPWAKSLKKVNKIKIIYHEACKITHESAVFLETGRMPSGHGVSEMTPEQREKIQIRHDEYAAEVDRVRTVYEATIYELNFMKHEYLEGMQAAFDKCVAIERERMTVFQECIELFAHAIDSGRNTQYAKVWQSVDMTLLNYTVDQDLEYFSATIGPAMPYKWPAFEEWENRPSQQYDD